MKKRLFLILSAMLSYPDGWHLTLQFMPNYSVKQAPLHRKMPAVMVRNRLRQGEKPPPLH